MKRLLLPFTFCLIVLVWLFALPTSEKSVHSLANGGLDPDVLVVWKQLASYGTNAIAIDPLNPANIYIAEEFFEAVAISRDYGHTWTSKMISIPSADGEDIAIDPIASNYLYVSLSYGEVYRSVDSGESWQLADSGINSPYAIHDLYVHPITPTLVFALPGSGETIYRSDDRAQSWDPIVLPGGDASFEILTHPSQPNKMFIANEEGIYVSLDAGLNWTNTGLPSHALAIDANNGNIMVRIEYLYCNVYRTTNGGANWVPLSPPTTSCYDKIVLDPSNSDYVYLIGDSRIPARSLDGGQTWQELEGGTNAVALGIDPTDSTRVYAGQGFYQLLYLDKVNMLPVLLRR